MKSEVALERDFARLTPASDLMRPGEDVPFGLLELGLRLFHGELLVSDRLLQGVPARCEAMKRAARRHGFDIGVEHLFGRLEVVRDDSLHELTRTGELHGRKLAPADTTAQDSRRATTRGSGGV